ncbi:hypothetical protein SAMN05216168_4498 [Kosakonia radicincitans]|nr:hypothetical protein SAMN05216168_4498 [Kosakonia radicincitans]
MEYPPIQARQTSQIRVAFHQVLHLCILSIARLLLL